MGVQWRPISGSIHDLHVSAPGPYVAGGGFFKNLVCGFQKSIFHRLVRCVQKARNQSLGLLLGQFDPHLPWFRRISILRGFKNFRIFGDHAIFEVSLNIALLKTPHIRPAHFRYGKSNRGSWDPQNRGGNAKACPGKGFWKYSDVELEVSHRFQFLYRGFRYFRKPSCFLHKFFTKEIVSCLQMGQHIFPVQIMEIQAWNLVD